MRLRLVLPLATVALAAVLPAQASAGVASIDGVGGCSETSIASAVANAGSGDTIYVKPGTYVIDDLVIADDITLISSNASCDTPTVKQVAFVGNNIRRMFTVSGAFVQFKDLTIRDNNVALNGPLLEISYGSVALYNVDVRGGVGSAGGCVVMFGGAGLTLLDGSSISYCEATNGGGVYVDEGTILAMAGTSIHHNAASADGGGLYLNYGDTYLYGDLTDNSAGSDGGGLYAHGRPIFENPPSSTTSIIQVSGGDVSRNTVEGNGGGIYFDRPGSTLTVKSGASIEDNAATNGGGMMLVRGTTNLSGQATVAGNDASGNGGAIWAGPAFTALSLTGDDVGDIQIRANTAGGHGGGLAAHTPHVETDLVTFIDNVATDTGGGVYAADPWSLAGTLDFRNTRFLRNEAKHGGGLLADDVTVEISSDFDTCDSPTLAKDRFCTEFRKNVTDPTLGAGGGLAVRAGGSVTVEGASFFQNTGDRGLAVAVAGSGSSVLVRNSLVWDHATGTSALWAESSADLDVRASTLVDNGVPADWDTGTTGAFHRNIVLDNSGTLGAGGISGDCNLLDLGTAPTGSNNAFLASGAPPQFETTNARSQWMPTTTSAAIDACGAGPAVDIDGTSRAQGADYDRGAFERP